MKQAKLEEEWAGRRKGDSILPKPYTDLRSDFRQKEFLVYTYQSWKDDWNEMASFPLHFCLFGEI